MIYEERLKMYAQQHADKWNKLSVDEDAGWQDADCLGDAEVTCAAAAEAIRAALTEMYDPDPQGVHNLSDEAHHKTQQQDIDIYLKVNGYVPQTEHDEQA